VDKTGTLTEGQPKLVSVEAGNGFTEDAILRYAATVEAASEHPLAAAIVAGARERGVKPEPVTDFHATTGQGVSATVDGNSVLIGNRRLLETAGIDCADLDTQADQRRAEGQTVMLVAIGGQTA